MTARLTHILTMAALLLAALIEMAVGVPEDDEMDERDA